MKSRKNLTKILLSFTLIMSFFLQSLMIPPQNPAYADVDSLRNGLVGYWPLDSDTNDYSYYNNNPTTVTGVTPAGGRIDGGYSFDPALDDYISIPDSSSLDVNSQLTMSFWLYRDSKTSLSSLVMKHDDLTQRGYGSWMQADGSVNFQISNDGTGGTACDSNVPVEYIPDNEWVHFVGTYDGLVAKMYINGVERNTHPCSGSIFNSSMPLVFGRKSNGGWTSFDGSLDEVAIWGRALSQSEIDELYNSGDGISLMENNPRVVIAEWNFEDATKRSSVDFVNTFYSADAGTDDNTSNAFFKLEGGATFTGWVLGTGGTGTNAPNANNWGSGAGTKFWSINISTQGYQDLIIYSKQRGSSTGPRDYMLQWKYDVRDWSNVLTSDLTVGLDNWTVGVLNNQGLHASASNQSSVDFRWLMNTNTSIGGGTVANTGTDRIDDIVIMGRKIQYPVTFSVDGTGGSLTASVGGTDISSGDLVNYGSDVDFVATPAEGFIVNNWSVNGSIVPDQTGNTFTLSNLTENTEVLVSYLDIQPPSLVSTDPADNAENVAVDAVLQMTFTEKVQEEDDKLITIYKKSDNSIFEQLYATSTEVIEAGTLVTIDPVNSFENDTEYYVLIDNGIFSDKAGNVFQGISDTTSWNFKTVDYVRYTVVNIPAGLSLEPVDPQYSLSVGIPAGRTIELYVLASGVEIGRISLTFDSDIDFVGVSGQTDLARGISFVHGLGTTFNLYVPKLAEHDRVYICPGATSLAEVTRDCAGGYSLSVDDINVTLVTIGSQLYWEITGLTGTGGLGYTHALANTGDDLWSALIGVMVVVIMMSITPAFVLIEKKS